MIFPFRKDSLARAVPLNTQASCLQEEIPYLQKWFYKFGAGLDESWRKNKIMEPLLRGRLSTVDLLNNITCLVKNKKICLGNIKIANLN